MRPQRQRIRTARGTPSDNKHSPPPPADHEAFRIWPTRCRLMPYRLAIWALVSPEPKRASIFARRLDAIRFACSGVSVFITPDNSGSQPPCQVLYRPLPGIGPRCPVIVKLEPHCQVIDSRKGLTFYPAFAKMVSKGGTMNTLNQTAEEIAEFDLRLAKAYASQSIRELREASEAEERETAWLTLYKALLA